MPTASISPANSCPSIENLFLGPLKPIPSRMRNFNKPENLRLRISQSPIVTVAACIFIRYVIWRHSSIPYKTLSKDTFHVIFRALVAKNYEKGKGKPLPYKQSYKLDDLSKAVDGATGYFANALSKGSLIGKDAMLKLSLLASTPTLFNHKTGKSVKNVVKGWLTKYRPYCIGTYHKYWDNLLIPQKKEKVDITLGLDVLQVEFFDNIKSLGFARHHFEKDKPYYKIFQFLKDGSYKVKLIPLLRGSHWSRLHENAVLDLFPAWIRGNELAEQRALHLVKLIYEVRYNPKTSFRNAFLKQFKNKEVTIFGETRKLWMAESGKDFKAENARRIDIFNKWFDRWEARKQYELKYSKKAAEQKWFNDYYDVFYRSYTKYMRGYERFLRNDPSLTKKQHDFWEWYHAVYLAENTYPS